MLKRRMISVLLTLCMLFTVAGATNTTTYAAINLNVNQIKDIKKDVKAELLKAGIKLLEKADNKAAIEIFNKLIKKYPKYADVYWRRGEAYFNMENAEKAEADFLLANKLDPNNGWPLYYLGELSFKAEKADKALDFYKRAVGCSNLKGIKDSYSIYERIAEIYMKKEDTDNAQKFFLEAFKLNTSSTGIKEIATKYFLKGDNAKALQIYKNMIEATPDDPSVAWVYLWIYMLSEDRSAAEVNITKAAALDPHYIFYILRTSMKQTMVDLQKQKLTLDKAIKGIGKNKHQDDAALYMTRAEVVRLLYKDEAEGEKRTEALQAALKDLDQADQLKTLKSDSEFNEDYNLYICLYRGRILTALGEYAQAKIQYDSIDLTEAPGDISWNVNEEKKALEDLIAKASKK